MTKKLIGILIIVLFIFPAGPCVMAAEKLTLMLDWFPNVDHLPIYVARHQGFFAQQGLDIDILSPSETSDALKLAAAGKVDIAISYEPQTIIAAARGLEITVMGRLIEHPLTTLLFLKGKGIETPGDLNGKKIGYTVPGLMDVLLDAFARLNAIENYSAVNVGFSIIQSLTAGKVDAVMGPFKTYETVTMAHKGYEVGYFELEKWGIPDYDELVLVTSRKTMNQKRDAMSKISLILDRAIQYVRANPEEVLEHYFEEVPEADRKIEKDAFELTMPYYAHHQTLDVDRWQQFADFALKYRLIDNPVDAKSVLFSK